MTSPEPCSIAFRRNDFRERGIAILIGINPLVGGRLLCELDLMGHGDLLVIADANFPAKSIGRAVERLPGVSSPDAAVALFGLFPIDSREPVSLMTAPAGRLAVQAELADAARAAGGGEVEWLDIAAFNEAARSAALIVQTGDRRPYANLIVRKGGITA